MTRGPILFLVLSLVACREKVSVMTVNGWLQADEMGVTLPHEHVLVDFVGADSIRPGRYVADSAFYRALPFLEELKKKGCGTLIECTPNYLGRDVGLLKRLSDASGVQIITNTGYYGAAGEKFLPRHVFEESAEQLAARWVAEWKDGVDGTGIRPGFMKLGADKGPLTEAQQKIMKAGALAHLETGLTIAVHTGDGMAAREELAIITSQGVAPEAFVWIHAQNEADKSFYEDQARQGAWVQLDGVNSGNADEYLEKLRFMKERNLLHRVLVSHDAGWYNVGSPGGGKYRGYTALFEKLIPLLKSSSFTDAEIELIISENPSRAYAVWVRKGQG